MRNQNIEFTYDGDCIKGILKINGEEIPVYLVEGSAEELYVIDEHYSPYTGIFLNRETRWQRTFKFKEIV